MNHHCMSGISSRYIAFSVITLSTMSFVYGQEKPVNWNIAVDVAEQSETNGDGQSIDFNATYFLEPLNDNGGPLAERDYLNPADTVFIRFFSEDITSERVERTGRTFGFGASRVSGKHIFTPRLFYTDFEDRNTFGAGIQYAFLLDDTSRIFGGTRLNREELINGSAINTTLSIGYRKMWKFAGSGAFFTSIGVEHTDAENEQKDFSISSIGTNLDYYVTSRWGIGLGLRGTDSDVSAYRKTQIDFSTSYAFSSKLSVESGAKANFFTRGDTDIDLTLPRYELALKLVSYF